MQNVKACSISKHWLITMEQGSFKTRYKVIDIMNDIKFVKVKDNLMLCEIVKHIPFLIEQSHDFTVNPSFKINDKWHSVSLANSQNYPKSVKVFQNDITPPDENNKYKRLGTRMVEIVFK